ncbi:hypothetical protein [Parachitinimonas caeni]|uniref:Uncharacterized protein n=1 Tax=Parachitinimonas caeni TaxID=3031301 RepID=A0ABT7DUR3_9NEIS|nr:hypothetical protein [Parachitinimonas caeni]MDK2123791.1 hypothetical protein [Parachitinimonas caeni]
MTTPLQAALGVQQIAVDCLAVCCVVLAAQGACLSVGEIAGTLGA